MLLISVLEGTAGKCRLPWPGTTTALGVRLVTVAVMAGNEGPAFTTSARYEKYDCVRVTRCSLIIWYPVMVRFAGLIWLKPAGAASRVKGINNFSLDGKRMKAPLFMDTVLVQVSRTYYDWLIAVGPNGPASGPPAKSPAAR